MLEFLLFFSFLSSQTFAAPRNLLSSGSSPNVGSISIVCSAPDQSFTEIADITISGNKISLTVTEGPYSTSYDGTVGTDGEILLQGDGECGGGISFTMDPGLIDGSESRGHATLSEASNYGCDGSTSDFSCKVQ
jgi:hypothetical protein